MKYPDVRRELRRLKVFAGTPPTFDLASTPDDPITLFIQWLSTAIEVGIIEPHAMTLSTISLQGQSSSRVVLLKDVSEGGWQFASSATSRKGKELARVPWASLVFYWAPLGRQVRISGSVVEATKEESAADFRARPLDSRIETLVGRQSQVLRNWDVLTKAVRRARERLERDPTIVAPHWALYTLRAKEVEFWQAAVTRQHRRVRYVRSGAGWTRNLLWP